MPSTFRCMSVLRGRSLAAPTLRPACRGKASVVAAASIFASVPQQTVAAVETTWVGASELIKEAVDEGHEQVSCALAGHLTTSHRCIYYLTAGMCSAR